MSENPTGSQDAPDLSDDLTDPDRLAHRDRREHGGASPHPDDDELAERTRDERVDVGLATDNPDEVPPASDDDREIDVTETPEYQAEGEEIRRQTAEGELDPPTADHPFPPSSYDS